MRSLVGLAVGSVQRILVSPDLIAPATASGSQGSTKSIPIPCFPEIRFNHSCRPGYMIGGIAFPSVVTAVGIFVDRVAAAGGRGVNQWDDRAGLLLDVMHCLGE